MVIRNVRIIDGTGAPPIEGATLLVRGRHIERVDGSGRTGPDGGERVIDAAGSTLLPGLIDAHVHLAGSMSASAWMFPLFRRFGVTSVRDVGGDPDVVLALRARERAGDAALPRIVAYGPLLDGTPAFWGATGMSRALTTVEAAREEAAALADRRVDGYKVYFRLPEELMRTVLEVAAARDLPVAGHIGAVSAERALELGVRSLEHASGVTEDTDEATLVRLATALGERHAYLVPTLVILARNAETVDDPSPPALAADLAVPPEVVTRWSERLVATQDLWRSAYNWNVVRRRQALVRRVHHIGGAVAVGTDTPNPYIVPGLSVHQEMEHLVGVGFTPVEAIAAATSVAATLLRRNDLGVIAPGRLADLVLVAGDPAIEIRSTRDVRMVMKDGVVVHASGPGWPPASAIV